MANSFKNAGAIVSATPGSLIYTTPSNATAVVHSLFVANTSSTPQHITVILVDASSSNSFRLIHEAPVPTGSTIVFDKPVNLETGDALRVIGSNAGVLHAVLSIMEIS